MVRKMDETVIVNEWFCKKYIRAPAMTPFIPLRIQWQFTIQFAVRNASCFTMAFKTYPLTAHSTKFSWLVPTSLGKIVKYIFGNLQFGLEFDSQDSLLLRVHRRLQAVNPQYLRQGIYGIAKATPCSQRQLPEVNSGYEVKFNEGVEYSTYPIIARSMYLYVRW